jgi:predicted  nucleic acid-binding Zn-ribbon protein
MIKSFQQYFSLTEADSAANQTIVQADTQLETLKKSLDDKQKVIDGKQKEIDLLQQEKIKLEQAILDVRNKTRATTGQTVTPPPTTV